MMIQPICKDPILLGRISSVATADDLPIANDLLETLQAHREECVGMAANMIGQLKRIIAFQDGDTYSVMFNPEIIRFSNPYEAEEGCLSLRGKHKAKRYETIKVRYQNEKMQMRLQTYSGWTAQIIQHEIDHCNGILI